MSHYQDGSRTSAPVEIYLFSGYFIQKNIGERDQKQFTPSHSQVLLARRASQVFVTIS